MPTDRQYDLTPTTDFLTLVDIQRWNEGSISMKQDVQSQTTTTIKPTRSRGERGSGTTITIDLSDQSELLAEIRKAAKADDREPSNFLRRCIVLLHSQGMLIPKEVITVTNKE